MAKKLDVPAVSVRIPQVDIKTALTLYYSLGELTNADIQELFGSSLSRNKLSRLKDLARAVQRDKEVYTFDSRAVNIDCAYEAWGLDVAELERKYKRKIHLGL